MKWFSNMKISVKLISAFVLVSLMAAIVGITGVVNMNTLSQNSDQLYSQNTVHLIEVSKISTDYMQIRINMRDIIFNKNLDKSTAKQKIDTLFGSINKQLEDYEKSQNTHQEAALISDMETSLTGYETIKDKIISFVNNGDSTEASKLIYVDQTGVKLATQIQEDISKLQDINNQMSSAKAAANSSSAQSGITIMTIVLTAAVLLALLLGILISRSISSPISKLVWAADQIADGDLNVSLNIRTRDEIGSLAHAFEKMIENLNDSMNKINSSAVQVATGSNQISVAAQALSQGSTEQASSIEEITASITEVAAQTKQNADNAAHASDLAGTCRENAVSGNSQMQEMLRAMNDINDSSQNISKIIKVIDDIAFQTNILALNAAVEAARAGQHGKGFAVVAEEVRNLAAKSADAAKETTAMIESSIRKVENGSKIANETAQALNHIVTDVAKAADIVKGIATASNEQASAIAQVNVAIEQVSQVVQTNTVTAEESASASEELSTQAVMLKDVVSKFNLRNSVGGLAAMDRIDPNLMHLIEGMIKDGKKHVGEREHLNSQENAAPADLKPPIKISLSDSDFDKY